MQIMCSFNTSENLRPSNVSDFPLENGLNDSPIIEKLQTDYLAWLMLVKKKNSGNETGRCESTFCDSAHWSSYICLHRNHYNHSQYIMTLPVLLGTYCPSTPMCEMDQIQINITHACTALQHSRTSIKLYTQSLGTTSTCEKTHICVGTERNRDS